MPRKQSDGFEDTEQGRVGVMMRLLTVGNNKAKAPRFVIHPNAETSQERGKMGRQ